MPRPSRLLPGVLLLLVLAALTPAIGQPLRPGTEVYRRTDRPNLVLLVADDLSPGDLGAYGATTGLTPQIDRMAARAIRFDQAYAGSTADAAARAALLTGLHAGHGTVADDSEGPLRPDDVTLAEVLRVASYPSGSYGRWSLGGIGSTGHPLRQGFNEFFGMLDRAAWTNEYPAALMRNEEAIWFPENQRGIRKDYLPDWILRASTNSLKFWLSRAFLLHVAMPLPALPAPGTNTLRFDDPVRVQRVQALDERVGRFLDVLDRLNLGPHTWVVLTSDQPGPDPEPDTPAWTERRLRVPLLVRPPGGLDAPASVGDPVAAWDILPTFAELARTAAPRRIDGRSFAPLLMGKPRRRTADYLYWRGPDTEPWEVVRFGRWKAIRPRPDAPIRLHDLEADPRETVDVASGHPEVLEEAGRHLKAAREPLPMPTPAPLPLPTGR